jgi:RNA polymerase sigma-70 factor (ECF subfamily)
VGDPGERVQLVQALTRHQSMIKAYAYAIARDFHLAEDVFQEVAVIVAQQWESVPAGQDLVPWLRETTRRKALEAARRQRRAVPPLSEATLSQLADSFRPSEPTPDLHEALTSCVERLAPLSRRVIQERCGDGRPCEEIASRVGRTAQAVYAILKRARLLLVQCVDRALAARARGELS